MRRQVGLRDIVRVIIPPLVHRICLGIGSWLFLVLWTVSEMASVMMTGRNVWPMGENQFYFWATGFSCLICLPILLWMKRTDERRKPMIRYTRSGGWTFLYIPILGMLSAAGVNNVISLTAIDRYFTGYEEAAQSLYSTGIWGELLILGLLVPAVEELVYRGLTYERMKDILSPRAAALWCSLIFGVLHGNATQGIYAFCLSFGMIYVKERYKTMAAPILFHMGANIYSVIVTETDWFSWMISSWEMFLAATVLALALAFLVLWRISEDVWAEKIRV